MKLGYKNLLLPLLLLLSLPLAAQQNDSDQIAVPLSEPGKPGKLHVQSLHGGIKVEGYEGKEVVVRYSTGKARRDAEKPAMVDGMRRVSDNNLGLEIREERNQVNIKVNSWMKKADLVVLVPYNFSLNLRTVNDGDIEVKDVKGELDISNVNGSVRLQNVAGAAVVNTVNGEIEVAFAEELANAPMSFTNINGEIQIKLPARARFNVKARSQFGDVFTNFDMKMKHENTQRVATNTSGIYRVNIDNWVQGEVNGGGPEIYLKSLNGAIYIQKN